MSTNDRELARRVVDQVERGVRRDGLTSGVEAAAEARRRFKDACPWGGEFNTTRANAYRREVDAALTRLYSPTAPRVVVEVSAPLVVPDELAAWMKARGVELHARRGEESA
jgi:hypothetical protein